MNPSSVELKIIFLFFMDINLIVVDILEGVWDSKFILAMYMYMKEKIL